MGSAGEIDKAYEKITENGENENLYLSSLNDIHVCKREMNDKRVKYIRLSHLLFMVSIILACMFMIYFYLQNMVKIGGI
ncbi:MAG: hypothetical protein LBE57_00215 [Methanosarcinales archaeon]|nr:hypothetical protein [Methanosarcinales archaeon]